MLVLRRRAGEVILLGGDIEIEVLEISRSRVKLGVRAPGHVPVVRKETVAVARENRMASDLVASRGTEGLGELMQLLNRRAAPRSPAADGPA
jgi:carbon storage regulator